MPVLQDFSLYTPEDGVLTIAMAPPVAIGGWHIEFRLTKRLGSTDYIILASTTSGYANWESGIKITNSGAGVFSIRQPAPNMSGKDPGVYAYQILRLNSGFHTLTTQGNRLAPM